MKLTTLIAFSLLPTLAPALALAGSSSSASYSVPADAINAAGARVTSASYAHNGSMGGIGGISSAAAPVQTAKHGYIGQLFDVAQLILNATPTTVNETLTRQLSAQALLDDSTVLNLPGSGVGWSVVSGPVAGISSTGLATAGTVYQDTLATVRADYQSWWATLNLTVLNTNPDNYGTYAGDGLPDDWQVANFGLDNPNAAPSADPDLDGQTNRFEYFALTNPRDPNSRFRLRLAAVPGFPDHKDVIFSPF